MVDSTHQAIFTPFVKLRRMDTNMMRMKVIVNLPQTFWIKTDTNMIFKCSNIHFLYLLSQSQCIQVGNFRLVPDFICIFLFRVVFECLEYICGDRERHPNWNLRSPTLCRQFPCYWPSYHSLSNFWF